MRGLGLGVSLSVDCPSNGLCGCVLSVCIRTGFAVGPVFEELLKFCAAASEGTDAPGIRPQALQSIVDALEANKAAHAKRSTED